jgi:putative transposase
MWFILPIPYLDCIVVKIRQDKRVINKAIYLALGVNMEGHKELLGMWLSERKILAQRAHRAAESRG